MNMEIYSITEQFNFLRQGSEEKEAANYKINASSFEDKYGVKLSEVERRWFEANISIWRDFYNRTESHYCMICESQVQLTAGIDEIEHQLALIDDNWDIFFPFDKIHNTSCNIPISVSRFGFYWGTSIYVLSREGAERLLDIVQEITCPLDEFFLEKGIEKQIRLLYAETDWYIFDETLCVCLLARKLSINNYIESLQVWDDAELAEVRNMLEYLSTIGRQQDVQIFLHAGTLLGAIRHDRIMPWDDDIDLMINRNDVSLLIDRIKDDGHFQVTQWTWKRTGESYFKIWKPGGFKVEGFEYTFPVC